MLVLVVVTPIECKNKQWVDHLCHKWSPVIRTFQRTSASNLHILLQGSKVFSGAMNLQWSYPRSQWLACYALTRLLRQWSVAYQEAIYCRMGAEAVCASLETDMYRVTLDDLLPKEGETTQLEQLVSNQANECIVDWVAMSNESPRPFFGA